MPTSKNQLPTLTPSAVQKFLTVNKVADQLDSISLLLSSEVITALPVTPATNKAYLVNFGANLGKLLYYYLDSASNALTPVYVSTTVGDVVGDYRRGASNWVLNAISVLSGGTLAHTVLEEGNNQIIANGPFSFSYTGSVFTNLAVANPLPLSAGLTQIIKQGTNYYVDR